MELYPMPDPATIPEHHKIHWNASLSYFCNARRKFRLYHDIKFRTQKLYFEEDKIFFLSLNHNLFTKALQEFYKLDSKIVQKQINYCLKKMSYINSLIGILNEELDEDEDMTSTEEDEPN